jgi:hypothetical protein
MKSPAIADRVNACPEIDCDTYTPYFSLAEAQKRSAIRSSIGISSKYEVENGATKNARGNKNDRPIELDCVNSK